METFISPVWHCGPAQIVVAPPCQGYKCTAHPSGDLTWCCSGKQGNIIWSAMAGYDIDSAALFAAGIMWLRSANGDSEVPDKDWTAWPMEWVQDAELGFQRWLLDSQQSGDKDSGADSRYRRCAIGIDRSGDGKTLLSWTGGCRYSVDFFLMTCMEQTPSDARGKILPLRRLE